MADRSVSSVSPTARLGGAVLGLLPMPRPTRYRLRLRHPAAARTSDAIADRVLPLLALVIAALTVMGLRPGVDPALRLFWLGSAFGLLTGLPYVQERRRLRQRLRELPAVSDPLDDLRAALPDVAVARALADGTSGSLIDAERLMEEKERDDPLALRVGAMAAALDGDVKAARARALRAVQVDPPLWEVPAQTGLQLCRSGRFGEGVRLLERATDVPGAGWRSELMLAHGLAMAGRLRDAVEAFDRSQGRSAARSLPRG